MGDRLRQPDAEGDRAPTVTLGMPVYNGADYVRSAIDAISAQTFTDFELIVSDNASTDDTPAILRDCAERDRRVRLIRQKRNIGAVANFAALVKPARGEFFAWVGAHDQHDPAWMETVLGALRAEPKAVIAYSHFCPMDEDGTDLEADLTTIFDTCGLSAEGRLRESTLFLRHSGSSLYGLMRTKSMRRVRIRRLPFWDFLFMTKLGAQGPFVHVDKILWRRRVFKTSPKPRERPQMLARQMRSLYEGGERRISGYFFWELHLLYLIHDLFLRPESKNLDGRHVRLLFFMLKNYWTIRGIGFSDSIRIARQAALLSEPSSQQAAQPACDDGVLLP